MHELVAQRVMGVQILREIGARSMRLLSNNPHKLVGIEGYGLSVIEWLPLEIPASESTRRYLKANKENRTHATIRVMLKRLMPFRVRHGINVLVGRSVSADAPAARPFYEVESLDRIAYERKWTETFAHRQEEYFRMHRRRYYETLNALAYFRHRLGEQPRVLEIGVSEFLVFYKHFVPAIRLVTVDRPVDASGFDPRYCIEQGGAEYHYEIDLNRELLNSGYGSPPLGCFDYVICTEIIEHLVINPVEFLESLISLLNPNGVLYLTTPNVFRLDNLRKIAAGVNPQVVFPRRGGNQDAHHHFREYEMNELVRFSEEAGGRILAHYFSGCWDDEALLAGELKDTPTERSNLVLLLQRV